MYFEHIKMFVSVNYYTTGKISYRSSGVFLLGFNDKTGCEHSVKADVYIDVFVLIIKFFFTRATLC